MKHWKCVYKDFDPESLMLITLKNRFCYYKVGAEELFICGYFLNKLMYINRLKNDLNYILYIAHWFLAIWKVWKLWTSSPEKNKMDVIYIPFKKNLCIFIYIPVVFGKKYSLMVNDSDIQPEDLPCMSSEFTSVDSPLI